MLNLSKIYTQKSNANRDIKKAVTHGECNSGDYEARKVDGGFQIFDTRIVESVIETVENVTDSAEIVTGAPQIVIMPEESLLNVKQMILSVYDENKKLVKGRRLDKTEFRETVVEKVLAQITDSAAVEAETVATLTLATINELIADPAAFCPMNDNELKMLKSIPLVQGYENIESTVGGKEFLQKVKELHNIEIATSRALMVSLKRKKLIAIGGGKNGGGEKTSITLLKRGIRHLNIA